MTKDIHTKDPIPNITKHQATQMENMEVLYPNTVQMTKIREIQPTLEDSRRLANCVNEWSDDDSWGGGFGTTEFTGERILKEWFATKLTRRMVVDEQGIIQGYCSIDDHWTDQDAMYAELLGVRPSQQKKGFGKALLLKAVETATQYGKRRLDLHTWAGNLRAVPVYKKTGFMWRPKTSVLMENFIPAILNTAFFRPFFSQNEWYQSRELTVTQKPDKYETKGIKSYFYRFIQDDQNSLTVYVDRHVKEISGFSYVVNGEELFVQLVPNLHEVFFGIDSTRAELRIKNLSQRPIIIKGSFTFFKGINTVSIESIHEVVKAKSEKQISIDVKLNPRVETYIPDQKPWKRTDCRLYGNLEIDSKEVQLAVGWVPKQSLQVIMSNPSAYFGRHKKQIVIPVGFRNIMDRSFDGRAEITGEGLPIPHEVRIDSLKPGDAIETRVKIPRPKESTVTAWRWNIKLYQQKSDGESALPSIIRHISCYTKVGAVAYINPHKAAVIENEQIRFEFSLNETNELHTIISKDVGEFRFMTFGINIGKPFPAESSEFWRLDRPYKIIHRDSGISFKQEMLSEVEKPGLHVTRWIHVDAGKPFISCNYEMTNTSNLTIKNIAIRHWSSWRTPSILIGKYTLPLKSGWLVSDDPEFNDNFDFPQNADEYAESWLTKENTLGFGCGLIWDSSEVESIHGNPFNGPIIDTRTYKLQPGESITLGNFTWVFGRSIVSLTRNIWLNEFNDNKTSPIEETTIEYCNFPLEIRFGQGLTIPEVTKNPLPSLNWIDLDSTTVPLEIFYYIHRETPIEAQIDLESTLWDSPLQWKTKLEARNKPFLKEILLDKHSDSQIITFNGKIHLPYTSRPFSGAVIPFKSSGKVTLERIGGSWLFSNNLLSFQTSATHGASLYSGKILNREELFFSRFPNRESFVWFKRFIGGFHPFIKPLYDWDWLEFLDNVWIGPTLVKKDDWFCLTYQLNSPVNDFRLKDIACKITYYTRFESPLVWARLSFKNNSGIFASIEAGFLLFLKPIHELLTKRHNMIWTYSKTEKERILNTLPPDNWVIASFGDEKEKVIMISPDPKITLNGDYMNANEYCHLACHDSFKLAQGVTRAIDVILLFINKNTYEDIFPLFNQRREFTPK
ncbi:MAG: GNAT family N-acetyltransferase [Promethearchaeota archaeon]